MQINCPLNNCFGLKQLFKWMISLHDNVTVDRSCAVEITSLSKLAFYESFILPKFHGIIWLSCLVSQTVLPMINSSHYTSLHMAKLLLITLSNFLFCFSSWHMTFHCHLSADPMVKKIRMKQVIWSAPLVSLVLNFSYSINLKKHSGFGKTLSMFHWKCVA